MAAFHEPCPVTPTFQSARRASWKTGVTIGRPVHGPNARPKLEVEAFHEPCPLPLILSPGGGEETRSKFMAPMCVRLLEVEASNEPLFERATFGNSNASFPLTPALSPGRGRIVLQSSANPQLLFLPRTGLCVSLSGERIIILGRQQTKPACVGHLFKPVIPSPGDTCAG